MVLGTLRQRCRANSQWRRQRQEDRADSEQRRAPVHHKLMTTFEKYIDMLPLMLNYQFAVVKLRTPAQVGQASRRVDSSQRARLNVVCKSGDEQGSTGIDLASKARSAPASKARTAEVWPGPPRHHP
eukprot:3067073-Pleurochrysis_carterae.AAC.1